MTAEAIYQRLHEPGTEKALFNLWFPSFSAAATIQYLARGPLSAFVFSLNYPLWKELRQKPFRAELSKDLKPNRSAYSGIAYGLLFTSNEYLQLAFPHYDREKEFGKFVAKGFGCGALAGFSTCLMLYPINYAQRLRHLKEYVKVMRQSHEADKILGKTSSTFVRGFAYYSLGQMFYRSLYLGIWNIFNTPTLRQSYGLDFVAAGVSVIIARIVASPFRLYYRAQMILPADRVPSFSSVNFNFKGIFKEAIVSKNFPLGLVFPVFGLLFYETLWVFPFYLMQIKYSLYRLEKKLDKLTREVEKLKTE